MDPKRGSGYRSWMAGPPPKRRKYRANERHDRDAWGPEALEAWLASFAHESAMDFRPPKSSLSGWEILDGIRRFLSDPEGICAAPRIVGGQCAVAAGEATVNEVYKSFGDACWSGAVRLIVDQATGRDDNNMWLAHPLRWRLWQPNGPGRPWLIVRLATVEETDLEIDEVTTQRQEYAEWVAAINAEPDPDPDPDPAPAPAVRYPDENESAPADVRRLWRNWGPQQRT